VNKKRVPPELRSTEQPTQGTSRRKIPNAPPARGSRTSVGRQPPQSPVNRQSKRETSRDFRVLPQDQSGLHMVSGPRSGCSDFSSLKDAIGMAYEDTDRARLREPSRKELWPSRAEKNFRGESNAIIQRKAPDEMRTMAHVPQSECSDLDSVAARLRREEDADVREADYLRFCDDNERARLAREAKEKD